MEIQWLVCCGIQTVPESVRQHAICIRTPKQPIILSLFLIFGTTRSVGT